MNTELAGKNGDQMEQPPIQPQVIETPPPSMEVFCPHCQTRLSVMPQFAGSTLTCPKCEGKFQAPLPVAGARQGSQIRSALSTEANSKKLTAGLCGIMLGGLGVHKFILGYNNAGGIMLGVWLTGLITGMCIGIPLLATMAMSVIGLIEGIIYITKTDDEFHQTYILQRREWF